MARYKIKQIKYGDGRIAFHPYRRFLCFWTRMTRGFEYPEYISCRSYDEAKSIIEKEIRMIESTKKTKIKEFLID